MNADECEKADPPMLGSPQEASESESLDQDPVPPCGQMRDESDSEEELPHPYEQDDKKANMAPEKERQHIEAARSKLNISPPRGFKRSNAEIWEEKITPVVLKKPKAADQSVAAAAAKVVEKKKPAPASKKGGAPAETFEAIRESFSEPYRPTLALLPWCLQPSSSRHGQHSYTKMIGSARIEVLLRQRALKPKNKADGSQVQTKSMSFAADNVKDVCRRVFLICGLSEEGEVP